MGSDGARTLLRWAEIAQRAGWQVTRTKRSHLRWQTPDGRITFTPGTPSGGKRALQNTRRDLRRLGLDI